MRRASLSVALGAFVFTWASVGFSQQVPQSQQAPQAPQTQQPPQAPQVPQTPQTPQTPAAPPPAQTQPVQSVYVQPPAAPPSAGYAEPAARTSTTSALYPTNGDMRAEKRVEHLPNKALLTTGVTLFAVSYVPSVVAGGASPRDEDRALFVPAVGPWIDLANRSCTSGCGSSESTSKALIVTSGLMQSAGIILGVVSFFAPESDRTIIKRDVSKNVNWQIVPVSYGGGGGVGAVGSF